jgi:hypothetical protein
MNTLRHKLIVFLLFFYTILKSKYRSVHSSPHSTLSPCHSRSHMHRDKRAYMPMVCGYTTTYWINLRITDTLHTHGQWIRPQICWICSAAGTGDREDQEVGRSTLKCIFCAIARLREWANVKHPSPRQDSMSPHPPPPARGAPHIASWSVGNTVPPFKVSVCNISASL